MATTEQTYSYSVYRDEKHDFENTKADEDGMQTRNDVYVLDASLKTVGSVTGLAEGEQVFSARFDGDYGYLCTYRQTDPVFAVDLTEPTNPKVVGELQSSAATRTICTSGRMGCCSVSVWRRSRSARTRPWTV